MTYIIRHNYLWVPAILFVLLSGCAVSNPDLFPPQSEEQSVEVIIVRHGWHVGLAVPVDSTFRSVIHPDVHAHGYRFAEFGWGDRDYYTGASRSLWAMVRGALWPTRSVVHVAAFDRHPADEFRGLDLEALRLSPEGYHQLLTFIMYTMDADYTGSVVPFKPGLYAHGVFYSSSRRYFWPRTSNTWVARLLQEAGAPFRPFWSPTAGSVMRQARSKSTTVP